MRSLTVERLLELVKTDAPIAAVFRWLTELWDAADVPDTTLDDYYDEREKATRHLEWDLDQVYGEFLPQVLLPQLGSRQVAAVLRQPHYALVLMDSLSLREACLLRQRLPTHGYTVTTFDYAFSDVPANTDTFCQRHWETGGPSAVNDARFTYVRANEPPINELRRDQLVVWGQYPDWFWPRAHTGKTEHIPPTEIYHKTETMLLGILDKIAGHNEIIISSDHGYLMLKAGMFWPVAQPCYGDLQEVMGGRFAPISDSPKARALLSQGVIVANEDRFLVKGRYTADFGIYAHGGLSLLECLTPWLVVRRG
jgi:hypothetical protein